MTTLSSQSRDSKDAWRLGNAGRILGNAVTRFEARVLELMSDAGHADTDDGDVWCVHGFTLAEKRGL